jgi:hypothetical protein
MTVALRVLMDANEADPPLTGPVGDITVIAGEPNATDRGLAAVCIAVELEDGQVVLGRTTLALFKGAARALAVHYPDPRR